MIPFIKMDACGNDYIYIDCRQSDSNIRTLLDDPALWAVKYSDRHHGIGADGMVLIDDSDVADAKMRMFNADGSEGRMCGNAIRCVGWLLYERLGKTKLTIETLSGVRELEIQEPGLEARSTPSASHLEHEPRKRQKYTPHGGVVTVNMGPARLQPSEIPVCLPGERVVARKVKIGNAACSAEDGGGAALGDAGGGGSSGEGAQYSITCVSMGNPHCVILVPDVETVDVSSIGSAIENCVELFPDRVNVEFVEIVDSKTLKMRVWERGSGETLACGTGACAAVTAAVLQGLSQSGEEITVQLRGGELRVRYTEDAIYMTGPCTKVYTGEILLEI